MMQMADRSRELLYLRVSFITKRLQSSLRSARDFSQRSFQGKWFVAVAYGPLPAPARISLGLVGLFVLMSTDFQFVAKMHDQI